MAIYPCLFSPLFCDALPPGHNNLLLAWRPAAGIEGSSCVMLQAGRGGCPKKQAPGLQPQNELKRALLCALAGFVHSGLGEPKKLCTKPAGANYA